MEDISIVITILTSLITPAILILASGSLSLTTSQRLSRSIERARRISLEFRESKLGNKVIPEKEKYLLYLQLVKASHRSKLLQRAMTLLYIALFLFIATSALIGIFEILDWAGTFMLIVLPMLGVLVLLAASIILILESWLALKSVDEEMKFNLTAHNEFDLNRIQSKLENN
jgi:hypothetical protein